MWGKYFDMQMELSYTLHIRKKFLTNKKTPYDNRQTSLFYLYDSIHPEPQQWMCDLAECL